jgi:hypothetical protein
MTITVPQGLVSTLSGVGSHMPQTLVTTAPGGQKMSVRTRAAFKGGDKLLVNLPSSTPSLTRPLQRHCHSCASATAAPALLLPAVAPLVAALPQRRLRRPPPLLPPLLPPPRLSHTSAGRLLIHVSILHRSSSSAHSLVARPLPSHPTSDASRRRRCAQARPYDGSLVNALEAFGQPDKHFEGRPSEATLLAMITPENCREDYHVRRPPAPAAPDAAPDATVPPPPAIVSPRAHMIGSQWVQTPGHGDPIMCAAHLPPPPTASAALLWQRAALGWSM